MKKSTIIISSIAVLTLAGFVALKSNVYADDTKSFSPLIQKIMDKFNISSSDMTATLDEFGQERNQLRKDHMTSQLDAAVADGKLTEDQKNQFLELNTNWFNQKNDWKDMTREERNKLADEHRAAMDAWETSNGVDMQDIMEGKMGFGEGFREGSERGMMGQGRMYNKQN